jgi:hypothetical protein
MVVDAPASPSQQEVPETMKDERGQELVSLPSLVAYHSAGAQWQAGDALI